MKRGITILVLLVMAIGLNAQTPIAGTDDFMAPKINPAAMGFGNSTGFSFIGNYDEDGIYEDSLSVMISGDNFGYVLDVEGNDNFHRLAMCSMHNELARNLYFGLSWDWKNDKFKDGDLQESILYRPTDYLSVGAIAYDLLDGKASYNLGIAVRPLFLSNDWAHRVTLSADTFYDQEDLIKPVVGIQTELFDGIRLGGSYDVDNETVGVNFGITLENISTGSFVNTDKDKEFHNGSYYVNISDKTFKSFINFKKNQFVNYKLKGQVFETKPGQKIGPFTIFMGKGKTLSQIIKELNTMKDDENVSGIVIQQANFSAKLAQREELRDAFMEFKAAGKKVVFYYEGVGGSNYAFAASIADEIYLNPSGMVDFKGLSVNSPYFKSLLDTLGIDIVNLRSHDYKTAGNMLSEEHMTDAERESYQYLLDGIFAEISTMIEEGRGDKLKSSVEELINESPIWTAEAALEKGMIDGIIYQDELQSKLEEKFDNKKLTEKYTHNEIRYDWSDAKTEKVALIYAVGNIHSGKGVAGKSIGSVTTATAIKKAREDKTVKGIIIRVDSGGGSALASDIIARQIELCKTGKNQKPVIASMGGVAASGGYFISTYADKIIAQPSTITGSIGVVGVFPIFERMYEKIHINWDTVKIGKFSDFGTTSRMPTSEEKDIYSNMIHHFYDRFVSSVAEGRGMEVDDVHKYAQGRVWTGRQALERGLVDAIGGMNLAKIEMQELLNSDKDIELVNIGGKKGNHNVGFTIDASSYIPEEIKSLWKTASKFKNLKDEKVLMVLPFEPEFK
jgi:protease IV